MAFCAAIDAIHSDYAAPQPRCARDRRRVFPGRDGARRGARPTGALNNAPARAFSSSTPTTSARAPASTPASLRRIERHRDQRQPDGALAGRRRRSSYAGPARTRARPAPRPGRVALRRRVACPSTRSSPTDDRRPRGRRSSGSWHAFAGHVGRAADASRLAPARPSREPVRSIVADFARRTVMFRCRSCNPGIGATAAISTARTLMARPCPAGSPSTGLRGSSRSCPPGWTSSAATRRRGGPGHDVPYERGRSSRMLCDPTGARAVGPLGIEVWSFPAFGPRPP